jgi:hypothetical protein
MRCFFYLFISVLYAFSMGYNTVYSATKAGVELHCSFRRPGTITNTTQQMYVCQLFGNFTNAAVATQNRSAQQLVSIKYTLLVVLSHRLRF